MSGSHCLGAAAEAGWIHSYRSGAASSASRTAAMIRQLFRGDAVLDWAESRSTPEGTAQSGQLRDVWGDIATFTYPFIKLDLKTESVNTSNSTSSFDAIELTHIIPNHVKDWENNQFHTYFSNLDNHFSPLLRIVDQKIGEIMDVDIDDDGNKLDGEELTLLHAKRINAYFASIGQPDLLGQVWPSIADPNRFSIPLDQIQVEQGSCKTQ